MDGLYFSKVEVQYLSSHMVFYNVMKSPLPKLELGLFCPFQSEWAVTASTNKIW